MTTPVEEIRRAAELMRERARRVGLSFDASGPNREYIASWHPGVALAVADWLDSDADDLASAVEDGFDNAYLYEKTLAVARAYLGGAT